MKHVERLIACIEEFRKLSEQFPPQTMLVFLEVARNGDKGTTMTNLAQAFGMSQSAISRNVTTLSKVNWHKTPGLDLVDIQPDPYDFRRKLIKLNAKGRRIAKSFEALMEG